MQPLLRRTETHQLPNGFGCTTGLNGFEKTRPKSRLLEADKKVTTVYEEALHT